MAIRLGSTCSNCSKLTSGNMCSVHHVEVGALYTCDKFEMQAKLADQKGCTNCLRFKRDDCANPEKAAIGMMCATWAPQSISAA